MAFAVDNGLAGPRILVAIGDMVTRLLTVRALESKGYDVQTHDDGLPELPQAIQNLAPELVVLDMGPEQEMNHLRQASAGLNMIMLGAEPEGDLEKKARKFGASDYLRTPVCLPSLMGKVADFFLIEDLTAECEALAA